MKLIYFHQHFSTPSGSTGTRSYEMAQALLRNGHSVTIVCGSFGAGDSGLTSPFKSGLRKGVVDGITVIELNLPYSNNLGFLSRCFAFLSYAIHSIWIALREDYDIAFATSTPLTAGIPGIIAKWIRRKRFIFEVRDLWPELPKAMGVLKNPVLLALMDVLEWITYKSANRLVGLSPGIVDGIAKRGINRTKITMIPNGCDLQLFGQPTLASRPKNVRTDQLLAIFTGTHGIANGLDAVLDAAAVLKSRKRNDVCILLVGEGSEKNRLMQRKAEEKLHNVIFLDPISKTDLPSLMQAADIGLQTLQDVPAFYFGTSPNKFFDYISSGLPVLNNYPGWLAELITTNDCGFSVKPGDPIAFAQSLIWAADNRSELDQKRKNAKLLAREQFDRAELSDAWVSWVTQGAKLNN